MAKKRKKAKHQYGLIIVATAIVFFSAVAAIPLYAKKAIKTITYYDIIVEHSEQYDVDPLLVVAVISVESRFRPSSVSHKGAVGLMQVMPTTGSYLAGEIGIADYDDKKLSNPDLNIRLGVFYLGKLLRRYDDEVLALAAYNAGEGTVDNLIHSPGFKIESGVVKPSQIPWLETQRYVRSTSLVYSILKIAAKIYGY